MDGPRIKSYDYRYRRREAVVNEILQCFTSASPQGVGSCEGQRHSVTSRMPLTGASGSLGDLGR